MPPSKPPITDPEREAVAKAAKTASLEDEPQLPTRPEDMSREVWIVNGRFGPDALRRIGIEYADLLDRINPSVIGRVSSLLSSDKPYAELLYQVKNYAAELDKFDAEPPKYETIGLDTKTMSQTADPILPTRPEKMTRDHFVANGGFPFTTMLSLCRHYAKQLDRIDTLPVLPNPPDTRVELKVQVIELQRLVTELVDAAKGHTEPCKECRTWEKRRDNAEQAAKAYQFSSEENLKLRQQEKQKNATLIGDLTELKGTIADMISQAERDDGVEVVVPKQPSDTATPRPWSINLAPLRAAGTVVGIQRRDVRVLSEPNFRLSVHCVNCHAEFLAACKDARGNIKNEKGCRNSRWSIRVLTAIIEKAEATP